ncbi:MAG: hypothetical protein IJT12_04075, partial [Paludibacteraceae bacterium]|nr:hypothetical protein [Paludibacteraceae bacterium]
FEENYRISVPLKWLAGAPSQQLPLNLWQTCVGKQHEVHYQRIDDSIFSADTGRYMKMAFISGFLI